jgi:hypothetical protein
VYAESGRAAVQMGGYSTKSYAKDTFEVDYTSFKPWLRDEFIFRCVYCLTRERWCPAGHEDFSVEHFIAQATDPRLLFRSRVIGAEL